MDSVIVITSLTVVSVLLINSLGVIPKLMTWLLEKLKLKKKLKFSLDDNGIASLKLEAQKINEYNGDFDAWPRWKSRTECALNGSGYDQILIDQSYAKRNPKMNAIVYSQLAVATVDGNAHHLVKQYEDDKDGHQAWKALLEWYDGDVIRNETAEALREKLETLSLHPGISASEYVNKYRTRYQELEKIPGEGNLNLSDDEEKGHDDKNVYSSTKKAHRLKGTFETTNNGFLCIPDEQWDKLTGEDKAFVQKYNAKVKHKEPLNKLVIPDGVIIKSKPRRNRASISEGEVSSDNKEEDQQSPSKKQKKGDKKISFNLNQEDDTSE